MDHLLHVIQCSRRGSLCKRHLSICLNELQNQARVGICQNNKLGRGKNKCKGPGTGLCLRNREDASVAGVRESGEGVEISQADQEAPCGSW